MTQESTPVRAIVLSRLSAAAYASLEKQTLGMLPKVAATHEQALVQSGVELVLRTLRQGFVIGGDE